MIRKHLSFSFLLFLALLIPIILLYQNYLTRSFDVKDTNTVDIQSLDIIELQKVLSEDYKVYLISKNLKKQIYFNNMPIQSLTLSPSQQQVAFFYESTQPSTEGLALALNILDFSDNKMTEIYNTTFPSWDVTSKVNWIGNDNIFFLRHCGTNCQGITLLNTKTKEIKNAVLSYSSFKDTTATTHFQDWFGQEFIMDGFVYNVKSKTLNNDNYLVFTLKDNNGAFLEEKSILFPQF